MLPTPSLGRKSRHQTAEPVQGQTAGRGLVIVAASQSLAAGQVATGDPVVIAAEAVDAGDVLGGGHWVRVLPAGRFGLRDRSGTFRVDPPAVVAASAERAAGVDLPVDYDHQLEHTERNGGGAPASGWIRELQARADGVWARIEWTAAAAERIRAREYRYLSPVFGHDGAGNVLQLLRAGLTNKPALLDAPRVAASQEPSQMDRLALIAALGLAAAASDQDILGAIAAMRTSHTAICAAGGVAVGADAAQIVAAIQARATPDASQWIAAGEYNRVNGELATLQGERSAREIEAAIDGGLRAGKIAPASRDYWVQICAAAKSAAPVTKFLESAPVVVPGGTVVAGAQPPAGTQTGVDKLTDAEREVCAQMGIAPEKYLAVKAA